MNTSGFCFSPQRANLLHLLLKHPTQPSLLRFSSLLLRHFSCDPSPTESTQTQTNANSSAATELIELLQSNNEDNWNENEHQIHHLLSSIIPCRLPQILRRLPTSSKALKFYQWVQTNSPTSPMVSPSIAYQAIFELASREPDACLKLSEILHVAKTHGVPLTTESASVLVRHFGRAQMVSESIRIFNEFDPTARNTHLYNTLLDVLYRADRFVDAKKVFDEMLEPDSGSPPNELTGSIVFSALFKRFQPWRSANGGDVIGLVLKFGEHGVFPDPMLLTKLIAKLCKDSNVDQAWEVLHVVMKLGGHVDVDSFNALLVRLGRECNFDRMNVLMAEMKEMGIHPNGITFGILINHLCKSRRVDEAMHVFDKMSVIGENGGVSVVPDLITYNSLIKGLCKLGRQDEGVALVDKMRLQHGYAPNIVTYNCLLDGFCKTGQIERSHELFEQMKQEGVAPDVITLNILVGGMCKHGRISSALEFFNDMQRHGLKGNTITYTALISAFLNVNNINKAMDLFDEMVSSRCAPDSIVYYSLIHGLSRAGRLDDACAIASRMKREGFGLDAVSYNVLINGFCKKNRMDEANEMLKEMKTAGIRPDEVTYNTLIASLSKSRDFTTVNRLLMEMIDRGLVPTVVTYGALIHGYCEAGNLDEAMKIFSVMGSTSKVPPNTVIYNILINSLCEEKRIEEAVSLMDEMQGKGVFPNVITFNAVFRGLKERNWLDKAFELMNRMNELACNPDYVTMEILTEWLSAVGETARLRSFVQGDEVSVSVSNM